MVECFRVEFEIHSAHLRTDEITFSLLQKYLTGNPGTYWLEHHIRSGMTHKLISYPDIAKEQDDGKDNYDYILCSAEGQEEVSCFTIGSFILYPCLVVIDHDDFINVGNLKRSIDKVAEMNRPSDITPYECKNRLPFVTDILFGSWALSNAKVGLADWSDPSVIYEINEYARASDEDKAGILKERRQWVQQEYELKFAVQWRAEMATIFPEALASCKKIMNDRFDNEDLEDSSDDDNSDEDEEDNMASPKDVSNEEVEEQQEDGNDK
ncbi:hypothetical protein KEM55_007933 [Ascosphaera atra]|nr:hypothetical protein KEM55_007933 [Ascosphaera atra]